MAQPVLTTVRAAARLIPLRRFRDPPPLVPVVRLAGVLSPAGASPLRRGGLNLDGLSRALERAFGLGRCKAVALAVNSPGGSAVQSSLIARRIRDLAAEKKLPVLAFAEDVAASGGYWLACAADEIYADRNSIIGSIGVISASFGFHGLIERHGVERRIHTAGERKSLLDPFVDETPEEVARLKAIQEQIHGAFKDYVRERRGDRLKGTEDELFSGEFWTGPTALELGLIDGIGEIRGVLRQKFGERVKLLPIRERPAWLTGRLGLGSGAGGPHHPGAAAGALGAGVLDWVLLGLEERAAWRRFGL